MNTLLRIPGKTHALAAGLNVRRLLPSAVCRAIGPFVFFDHFGPATLAAGQNADVGQHPHIGLATVSYLLEGHLVHRDSLGTVQTIAPGAVNWMTAGAGIAHSERARDEDRHRERVLHGLQLWVALPPDQEQCEPSFQHVPAHEIPEHTDHSGVKVRVLVGEAMGLRSPVRTASPTLYLDVTLAPGARWQVPAWAPEMAVYSPEHAFFIDDERVNPAELVVLPPAANCTLHTNSANTRLVLIGGAPLEQPVRMWWNYVSVDRDRIAEAAQRWENGTFPTIRGEPDRIAGPSRLP